MKTTILLSVAVLLAGIVLGSLAVGKDGTPPAAPMHLPELEYLKAVNRAGPPKDPQVLFLLMAQYANANRHGEGAEFFSALLKEHEARLSNRQIWREVRGHPLPLGLKVGRMIGSKREGG